jgi:hypothetical protein
MSSFGGTVKLTGESEYRKALSEISSNLKVLNSEMKAVTSEYDNNDKSVENLSAQNDVLNKKIDEQEKKVNVLKDALAKSKEETGENSETTKKWQTELNNAQADLNKLNREVENNAKTMEDALSETKEEADAVEDFGGRILLGIYDHRNAQLVLHIHDLLAVFGISNARHGVFNTDLFGNQTGKHVQLVALCQGDHQLCLANAGLSLDIQAGTVAYHTGNIVFSNQGFHLVPILVNNRNVMTLAGKILQNRPTNGSKSDNYNFHIKSPNLIQK